MSYKDELYHHGILGQKWGKRNGPPYPLNDSDKSYKEKNFDAYRESQKSIKRNSDGSYSFPEGFVFNRVGKNTKDVRPNKNGALYVSYGKADASRYVKIYGPDLVNRIFKNTREAIQHISVKESIKLASDDQFVQEVGKYLLKDKEFAKSLNDDAFYGMYLNGINVTDPKVLNKMIEDPKDKRSRLIAWSVNTMFIDNEERGADVMKIYDYFIKQGFDAVPDIHDTWGGTSETATIIINPKKVKVTETTLLTKDVFMEAKDYVKTLEKLKVDEIFK